MSRLYWATLFIVAESCATYTAKPISSRPPSAFAVRAEGGGLTAGADAFDAPGQCAESLGEDVSGRFTPVQMVLHNEGPDKFIIERDGIKLTCGSGESLELVPAHVMYDEFKHDLAGAHLVGGPLAMTAAADANESMKADWAAKEVPAQLILGQARSVNGLLYFRGRCPGRRRVMRVTAEKVNSNEALTLEFQFGVDPARYEPRSKERGDREPSTPQ
jgi:hypothetical protein